MKTVLQSALLITVMSAGAAFAASHAQENPMVGGAKMMADMDIVDNAVNSAGPVQYSSIILPSV